MPWRIPYPERALFPPAALQERAAMPAGVRIAFRSDTTLVAGEVVPYPECVGINVYGASSLNLRTFRPAIIGFVQIIRERHPDVPFVVMSPIYSPPREETPNVVGMTLRIMREEVEAAVETLRAHGDRHLYYVNGLEILGPEHGHLLPDELHPNAEGYRLMGRNFLQKVAARYFIDRDNTT
jgi:hypothetical protein